MANSVIKNQFYLHTDSQSLTISEGHKWDSTTTFTLPSMSGYTIASISAFSSNAAIVPCGTYIDTLTCKVFAYNLADSARTANISLRVLYKAS